MVGLRKITLDYLFRLTSLNVQDYQELYWIYAASECSRALLGISGGYAPISEKRELASVRKILIRKRGIMAWVFGK